MSDKESTLAGILENTSGVQMCALWTRARDAAEARKAPNISCSDLIDAMLRSDPSHNPLPVLILCELNVPPDRWSLEVVTEANSDLILFGARVGRTLAGVFALAVEERESRGSFRLSPAHVAIAYLRHLQIHCSARPAFPGLDLHYAIRRLRCETGVR